MKRATVVCAMDPFEIGIAIPVEAEGYACTVHAIPMVVHRTLRSDDDGWRAMTRLWTVTEPITGRSVATSGTRKDAIALAEEEVWQHGGPEAVRREIVKHANTLATQPSTENDKVQR